MSDRKSDESISALSVPSPTQSQQDDSPALGDISGRDKVWDKHKANSDIVSDHYKGSHYHRYSQRIEFCADLLEFKLAPDQFNGVYRLKLAGARFCRVRTCPVCQWRRSAMWKAKACKVLPRIVKDYPKHRWLFLTLTLKNCDITELRNTINLMHKSFKRMTKLKDWKIDGWIKSTEVTRGRDGSAHPHFHCLLMVPASYFKGDNYISQQKWSQLWQRSLRIDYQPIVHVKAIAKHYDPVSIIPEILKYQVKESDLVKDRRWFLELTTQLHKTRAVAVGGILKDYLRELEEEPQDLIGEGEESDSVDEGSLYFGWKTAQRKYRMRSD